MFDNLCKSWPRESQQCINRLKDKQTSYRVLNTVLIKVRYDRCGSWPQKCYGDGYSTGWLRHFISTRRYEFFNFRSAEARSAANISVCYCVARYENFVVNQKASIFVSYVIKQFAHAFSCAYIELWMHLRSLESAQEARVALGCAFSYSYASFVLSKLPASIHNSIYAR